MEEIKTELTEEELKEMYGEVPEIPENIEEVTVDEQDN